MSYDTLRHLADSWGLVVMALVFLGFVGWALRPGAKPHHKQAAISILNEDDHG